MTDIPVGDLQARNLLCQMTAPAVGALKRSVAREDSVAQDSGAQVLYTEVNETGEWARHLWGNSQIADWSRGLCVWDGL